MPGIDVPTGRDIADLIKRLAEVRNNPAAIEAIREAGTSCLQWGDVLHKLMKPDSIKPLFIRKPDKPPTTEVFSKIARELKDRNCVMASVKFPGSTNHVFTIEGIGEDKAHILHAWQDMHQLRREQPMSVDKMVKDLQRLPTLDYVTDRAELTAIRGRLFGRDHAAIPDIGTSSRRQISFEMVIRGTPDGPLSSPINKSRLSILSSDLSHWESARSSVSGEAEWHSARSSFSSSSSESVRSSGSRVSERHSTRSSLSSEGEPHVGQRQGMSIRGGAGVGAGLGFVLGAGGVLLHGVIKKKEIDYTEVGLAGLKNALAGGAAGAAGAAAAKNCFSKIGTSVVRANVVSGVEMFGVFAVWDVTEWKLNKITTVELRQRLAEGSGAAGGGLLGAAGVGAVAGFAFGPLGATLGGLIGGIGGAIGGVYAGRAIDQAIWDESEDSVMNSYEFFGWLDVQREKRPVKTGNEMGRAYDKKRGEKPSNMKKEVWDKICLANLVVLVAAMYPEFKELIQLANNMKQHKSDALSTIATSFYEYLQMA